MFVFGKQYSWQNWIQLIDTERTNRAGWQGASRLSASINKNCLWGSSNALAYLKAMDEAFPFYSLSSLKCIGAVSSLL